MISTAIDPSARARAVGIETKFVNLRKGNVAYLPQRIAVFGQGSTGTVYATTKRQVFSEYEAGVTYGFGSPIHLAIQQLLPAVGTTPVTVYPLTEGSGATVAAGTITPTGTQVVNATYTLRLGGKTCQFSVPAAQAISATCTAIAAAINATLDMPVTATATATLVNITSKWKGQSANGIKAVVTGDSTAGTSFAIVNPTGGTVDPTVDTPLGLMGEVWETCVVNCLDISNTVALDAYKTMGENRWGATVRKPFVVFTGNPAETVANAIAVPDARKSDRVNAQIVVPGTYSLPLQYAAAAVARIAVQANVNPPCDYGRLTLPGIDPGDDSKQWTFPMRDAAIKGGSSSTVVRDNVVELSDTVTFYHPVGDVNPGYQYVCDLVKVMNVIYNIDLIFNNNEWDGAPLVPDAQPTTNPRAKKPMMAKASIAAMLDSLGLEAIVADAVAAKASVLADTNSQNPKRLDVAFTAPISGNANIISVTFNFGFEYGRT